ncbi:MAG TPA: four helix bundle protein [Thermoanaerobaculia bacterium]|nr:four helix bundle protein [Thermoanaerobaculia bacterium]
MSDSYRDLLAWQKAMALVTEVYRETESFPAREMYGLTNQVRRAAVGVPSDIAEGKGRLSKKEFVQMLSRARGSIHEVQTQLEIARNLGFLTEETFLALKPKADEVGRLINGLIRSIRRQIVPLTPRLPLRAKT